MELSNCLLPFILNFTTCRTNLHRLDSRDALDLFPQQEIIFLVNRLNMSWTHSPLHQSVYQLLCEGFHPSNNGVHPQIPESHQLILCNTWACCHITHWLTASCKLTMRELLSILKIRKNKLENLKHELVHELQGTHTTEI